VWFKDTSMTVPMMSAQGLSGVIIRRVLCGLVEVHKYNRATPRIRVALTHIAECLSALRNELEPDVGVRVFPV
jgi:hypothetical protein